MEIPGDKISTKTCPFAETAPKIKSFTIKKDKIRSVIGQGGSVIKDICAVSGATVEISDDGTVSIFSSSQASIDKAYEMVGPMLLMLKPEQSTKVKL